VKENEFLYFAAVLYSALADMSLLSYTTAPLSSLQYYSHQSMNQNTKNEMQYYYAEQKASTFHKPCHNTI